MFYTPFKNQLKMDQESTSKIWNYEATRGNQGEIVQYIGIGKDLLEKTPVAQAK